MIIIIFVCSWLEVKNWLVQSKRKVMLASKRKWKRYWVTLRGTTLMFYACDDQVRVHLHKHGDACYN